MLSKGELHVYTALYLNKEGLHVREVSRQAGLTLPAVSRHLHRGEERGIISCTAVGSMKLCRLNFGKSSIVPVLQEVELSRCTGLPVSVRGALTEFLAALPEKPLIALIFGSFATGRQAKSSDVDVLLAYQRIDGAITKSVEASASRMQGRTRIRIQPVSLSYDEFQKEMLDVKNGFMKDVRASGLVVCGLERYLDTIAVVYG